MGYLAVTASPWLSEVLHDTYGAATETFDLGVDHDLYHRAATFPAATTPSSSMRARPPPGGRPSSASWPSASWSAAARG